MEWVQGVPGVSYCSLREGLVVVCIKSETLVYGWARVEDTRQVGCFTQPGTYTEILNIC